MAGPLRYGAPAMSDRHALHPIDPSTERPLDPVPVTRPEEIAAAVARARAAAPAWRALGVDGRIAALDAALGRLREPEVASALARSITEEMGKPVRGARGEIDVVLARLPLYGERARAACDATTAREGGVEVTTTWQPLGVAAVIAPWNFPVATPNNLVVSALLTGNTCILKPSELTPHTGARYGALLEDALPDGVFQVVQGAGEAGAALLEAGVDLVAFTGSVGTGQAIMRKAADHMTRLVLEMGGKDPMIVLPGADLDAAARHAARASMANCGQVCVAVERVIVHREVHAAFVEQLVRHVADLRVGDPWDEATDLGPMSSARQRDHVLRQVEEAVAAGARVALEGRRWGPGFFLAPWVLDDVDPRLAIVQEETFGPAVTVEVVGSTEEAVARANASRYGLGASVWGEAGAELEALAVRIEAGMIGINRGLSAAAGAPWVGWKMSGYGYTRSVAGMRQFMGPRTLSRATP